MSYKICCFAGHKDVLDIDNLREIVYRKCEELVCEKGVNCFWAGNYGGFDRLAAYTVRKLKLKYPCIKLELILPYVTKEINDYKEMYYREYDEILIADMPERTPSKLKILKCNQYMVDCSDFLIA